MKDYNLEIFPDTETKEPEIDISEIPDTNDKFNLSDFPDVESAGVFEPTLKDKIVSGAKTYLEEGQAAFKWVVSGMPEDLEDIERIEKSSWQDIIRESYPMLKDPESKLAKSTAMQFGVEMAGDLLEMGTKPSTYITWGVLERFIPAVLREAFKKLPKGTQEALLKERFLWGKKPLDVAYKELSNAMGREAVYEKLALKQRAEQAEAALRRAGIIQMEADRSILQPKFHDGNQTVKKHDYIPVEQRIRRAIKEVDATICVMPKDVEDALTEGIIRVIDD